MKKSDYLSYFHSLIAGWVQMPINKTRSRYLNKFSCTHTLANIENVWYISCISCSEFSRFAIVIVLTFLKTTRHTPMVISTSHWLVRASTSTHAWTQWTPRPPLACRYQQHTPATTKTQNQTCVRVGATREGTRTHFCVTVVYWECVLVGLEYVECVCLFVCVNSLYINKNAQERDREWMLLWRSVHGM